MKTNSQDGAESFAKTGGGKTKSNAIETPSITLPKGGGAIRGIDEKFTVNAVNGTAAFSIPLPFSSPRGASPAIEVSYNSGSGNGVFGLGWTLGLLSIKRKSDNELPEYDDESDSDTFVLSGADDLVPEYQKEPDGTFTLDLDGRFVIRERDSADGFHTIRFYRPRIEGLFARIERWSHKTSGEIKWRVITRENVTTLFGWSAASRISDPKVASRIFEWLPELMFDDRGNCTRYVYKSENSDGLDLDLLHNRNRVDGGAILYTNLYLERVLYGNKTPYRKFGDPPPPDPDFVFQTVFDYGEYDSDPPVAPINAWKFRSDPFSTYKAGFEIRTTRLCERVSLFHFFNELAGGSALVRSMKFEYDATSEEGFTFLKSITSIGYIKQMPATYTSKELPPIEFDYQTIDWNPEIKTVLPENLVHSPAGLTAASYQFTDLYNEGLFGILTEQGAGWYYKHNLGNGTFEHAKLVSPKPSFSGLGNVLQLADLDADGGKQIVNYNYEPKGYFELNDVNEWIRFKSFESAANVNLNDPSARLLDLTGDGMADVLVTEDAVFTWHRSAGRKGFKPALSTVKPFDEEAGPHIVFAEARQTIFLADMTGDGLTDIVRIRNGEICYWPNLGYGRFGSKVAMDNAPVFDHPDSFDPALFRLADIDGSGTTDLIYLGRDIFRCWRNFSGNEFSKTPFEIAPFPQIRNQSGVTVVDLLGNGVPCIVCSSDLAKDATAPLRYIDLMNGKKPHIMTGYKNNFGKEVSFEYAPSTRFYIEDKLAGHPWVTKLHFPVHCLVSTETRDTVSGWSFVSKYKYHHGYFDHAEKEFRGFGMVEQIDTEDFDHWVKGNASNIVDRRLHQAPVLTRSWFHTGAFLDRERILNQFSTEYWFEEMNRQGHAVVTNEVQLPEARLIAAAGLDPSTIDDLKADEWREALRSCKGMGLRLETFAKDAPVIAPTIDELRRELTPYTVASHNCAVELLQPKGDNKHAVFVVKESESLVYNYERESDDPRVSHTLNIKLDELGNVLESASVVYPREVPDIDLPPATQTAQGKSHISYTQNGFTANEIDTADAYRRRLPSEARTYELKGVTKSGPIFSVADFDDVLVDSSEVGYHQIDVDPGPGSSQRRLIEHVRHLYYKDDLSGPLPLHGLPTRAFPFESFQLAYTPALIADIFGAKVNAALLTAGRFVHSEGDDNWWIRSGTTQFIDVGETAIDAANRFFTPISHTDPFGAKTKVSYFSNYFLVIEEVEDALQNKTTVLEFNMRTLTPRRTRDANNNISEAITDELGFVKATALFGKGAEGDDLTGIAESTTAAEILAVSNFLNASDSIQLTSRAKALLNHATSRYVYDLDAYRNSGGTRPAVAASIAREQHFVFDPNSPIQMDFEYSNGFGKVVMTKAQAEPGVAKKVTVNPDDTYVVVDVDTSASVPKQLRWIGGGRTILNNKGNPVKQYEPYFSVTHQFEDLKELVETGVTPLLYYDAASRVIKKEFPDTTFAQTTFDSWKQTIYDQNDTVQDSAWYTNRYNRLIDAELIAAGKDPGREKLAAEKSAKHHDTPLRHYFDALGRPVLQIQHSKDAADADLFFNTTLDLDVEGNLRRIVDARNNPVMQYKYDMLGNMVYQDSMDTGQRWLIQNNVGGLLRSWDESDHEFRFEYDLLRRPTSKKVIGGDGPVALDHVYEKVVYGEGLPGDAANNFRTRPVIAYDTAGKLQTAKFDFHGNSLYTSRRYFEKYKDVPNWDVINPDSLLEAETFPESFEYDAITRITKHTTHEGTVFEPTYNEASLCEAVNVTQNGATESFVKNIDYNEKGQRSQIRYGNDVTTEYFYDRETFRLQHLRTRRLNGDPLQDLYYTFDPVGNITHLEDRNIPEVFFNNQKVTGVASYVYDPLYQLIEASGREHIGTLSFGPNDNWNDLPFMKQYNAGDSMAWRNYTQSYGYDAAGNIDRMQHVASGGNWTRVNTYEAGSNRLATSTVGADLYNYPHHPQHGYLTSLPHLHVMKWNFKEELQAAAQQSVVSGTPETTWYVYDGSGQRVRKIIERQAATGVEPSKKSQRNYLQGVEVYREYNGAGVVTLERESFHVMDDVRRIAMIETRTQGVDAAPSRLVRYQFGNHLESASIEVDSAASVISYEEYHPFGTTSYQAVNKDIDPVSKRYRYTAKERDEETGLEYHGARYFMPWLARWLSGDPIGTGDGKNVYSYVSNNPVMLHDPNGTDGTDPWTEIAICLLCPICCMSGCSPQQKDPPKEEKPSDGGTQDAAPQEPPKPPPPPPLSQENIDFFDEVDKFIDSETKLYTKKIEEEKEKYKEKNWTIKEDEGKFKVYNERLEALKKRKTEMGKVRRDAEASTSGDNLLILANVVYNEAGSYGADSRKGVAYGYLNRTGGVVREPIGAEISDYKKLKDRWAGLSTTERYSFLKEFPDSVATAKDRLADTKAATNDPTKGSTHWISPEAKIFDKKKGGNTQKRTIDGKVRFVPEWARSNTDPKVKELQKGRDAILNSDFRELNTIPKFLFYKGVK